MEIRSQEEWVLHRLQKFYDIPENTECVRKILNGESNISLRLIDWFVTNYAKKYNIYYNTSQNKNVIVYLSYKSHLKAYSKKLFDPFCRWKRIRFQDMETTVGQLNFFEWAISDNILGYLEEHREEIHADMENRLQETNNTDKKRHELSRSATRRLAHHTSKITVKFD